VGRWRPDARQRLEQAAIELFSTQGFAATTVPQIAARAGLTTRTFFRHFADKREVLYGGDAIPELATRLITEAPAGLDPATLLIGGLQTVAETLFEGRREEIRVRRAIIRSDEGLRERDLRKRADLGEAIRAGFTGRGVDPTTAVLLAETAVTVIQVALEEWLDSGDRALFEVMQETIGSLQATLATFPPFPPGPASRR
jgi:AcrR family transcriptional regulator